jgi:hypothetical protein
MPAGFQRIATCGSSRLRRTPSLCFPFSCLIAATATTRNALLSSHTCIYYRFSCRSHLHLTKAPTQWVDAGYLIWFCCVLYVASCALVCSILASC